jgi:hypothetical protein
VLTVSVSTRIRQQVKGSQALSVKAVTAPVRLLDMKTVQCFSNEGSIMYLTIPNNKCTYSKLVYIFSVITFILF